MGWILVRRLGLRLAPVASAGIAADRDGYLAGLTQYRLDLLSPWIRWLSATVERTAGASTTLFEHVEALEAEWRGRVATRVRADAAALRALAVLPQQPALTVARLATSLGVSLPAARAAVAVLEAEGVLDRYTPERVSTRGRQAQWWICTPLTTLASGWLRLPGV